MGMFRRCETFHDSYQRSYSHLYVVLANDKPQAFKLCSLLVELPTWYEEMPHCRYMWKFDEISSEVDFVAGGANP